MTSVPPRRVLLLATTTGYQTRSFGDAADRLGLELVLATDRCHALDDPWRDRAIPVRFHDIPASLAAIRQTAADAPFSGVLAVGDRPVPLAALACDALGLPGHSPAGADASVNKLRMRERLRDSGLPVPWFAAYPIDGARTSDRPGSVGAGRRAKVGPGPAGAGAPSSAPGEWHRAPDSWHLASGTTRGTPHAAPGTTSEPPLPCVVKPLVLSGSRGVIRANTRDELQTALDRVARLLRSREVRALRVPGIDTVLVEGYLPGQEYAVEALLDRGHLRVLAVFDKPDPLEGPYFEETLYITPSRASAARQRALASAVGEAVGALGLWHGPVHAECRVDADRVYVLEVAARPIGGLCARALRFEEAGVPMSFEDLLLRHAAGGQTNGIRRAPDASGVLMIPIPHRGVFRRVDDLDAARQVPGITAIRITAKTDQLIVPLPEGAGYLGFIFASAATPDGVEAALREAHARLTFAIDPPLAMVAP